MAKKKTKTKQKSPKKKSASTSRKKPAPRKLAGKRKGRRTGDIIRIAAQVGQEQVFAECDREYRSVAKQILALMNSESAKGSPVFESMTIQFGWTAFMLKRDSGKLMLHEPDFDSDPMTNLRRNIDCSIRVYLQQQAVIADLGLSNWKPTRFFEDIVAAHGSLSERRLIAKHYKDSQGITGWVIFHAESNQPLTLETLPDQYGKLPAWQLLHARPGLLSYLALPPGFTVFLNGDDAEKIINDAGDIWQ
jgi:hypothetical protein